MESKRVSLRALSRHLDVALSVVQYYVKKGYVIVGEDGKVDLLESTVSVKKHINPSYHGVNSTMAKDDNDLVSIEFSKARAYREMYEAKITELKYKEIEGSLVELSSVEKIIFERGRQFRDYAMSLSRKLAPKLSQMDSIHDIERLLDSEIRIMLDDFTKLPIIE